MARKRKTITPDQIEVVGERRPLLLDAYHAFIRARWPVSLSAVAAAFVTLNFGFALAYRVVGGIRGATSLADLFFFSVQTSGTIGYGAMYPSTPAAHAVVTVEALTSILFAAITTGLVFAKFSTPRARVQFAAHPVVSPYDGVPTLQFRLGNQRDARLIEATLRVVALRTERTLEGVTMYRMYDLQLERDRSPALSRSWTVLHKLGPSSALHGATPDSLAKDEVEFILTLTGIDEVSTQMMHAQTQYLHSEVRFGARYADLLSEREDGGLRLDMRRFNELVTTAPTAGFPYGQTA
jgi:inward rectifier potassium channel